MVSSSLFAYVADGKNGLQVVQLFSPRRQSCIQRIQSAADAEADCQLPHARAGAGRIRRESIAIAPSTKAAINSRFSDAAVHVRSIARKWIGCICETGKSSP